VNLKVYEDIERGKCFFMFEDEYIKATGRIKRILEENSETKYEN